MFIFLLTANANKLYGQRFKKKLKLIFVKDKAIIAVAKKLNSY